MAAFAPALAQAVALSVGAAVPAGIQAQAPDAAVDWSKAPAAEVTLFQPGQSSWEWLNGAGHEKGARMLRAGKACAVCHEDEERKMGEAIAAGHALEPTPIPGKRPVLRAAVQAAYDAEHLYLRVRWQDDGRAGVRQPVYAYRNGQWAKQGSHRGDAAAAAGRQRAVYEDRFSLMIADPAKLPRFAQAGCWLSCHDDERDMPRHPAREAVEQHPVLGAAGMGKADIRKYLPESREGGQGWADIKPRAAIDALRDGQVLVDLVQWRAHRSNPAGVGDDGYVLEYRNFDAGEKVFADNWDKERKRPKWMLDPAKHAGKAAYSPEDWNGAGGTLGATDADSLPYDEGRAWREGDLLPQYRVTLKPSGSAADALAQGEHDGRGWTVVLRRKLDTGHHRDDVTLRAGQVYPIGLAVHDGDTTARWHYVSLPLRLSLGAGEGEIRAVRLP